MRVISSVGKASSRVDSESVFTAGLSCDCEDDIIFLCAWWRVRGWELDFHKYHVCKQNFNTIDPWFSSEPCNVDPYLFHYHSVTVFSLVQICVFDLKIYYILAHEAPTAFWVELRLCNASGFFSTAFGSRARRGM